MSDSYWLRQTERTLLVGAGLGTVASVAGQNAALAYAPLTALVALGFWQRQRTAAELVVAQASLKDRQQQLDRQLASLTQQVTALPSPETLTKLPRSLEERAQKRHLGFVTEFKDLRQAIYRQTATLRQDTLSLVHQDITQLRDRYAALTHTVHHLTDQIAHLASRAQVEILERQLSQISRDLRQIGPLLTQTPAADTGKLSSGSPGPEPLVTPDELNTLMIYVDTLRRQQADLEQALGQLSPSPPGEGLDPRSRRALERLLTLMNSSRQATRQIYQRLTSRLDHLEEQVSRLGSPCSDIPSHWILDFSTAQPPQPDPLASTTALHQALARAERRVILVWPWTCHHHTLDEPLLASFRELLERGGQLSLGWCHPGNQQQGRWVAAMAQDRSPAPASLATLTQLLPLRRTYGDRLQFKVIGTAECYLVCDSGPQGSPDRTYAILSLPTLSTFSAAVPGIEAKLQTAHPQIVQTLIEAFESPHRDLEDRTALFNRATTYHDLGDRRRAIDDYSRLLDRHPHHSVAANNRGVAYQEMGLVDRAALDFSTAILQGHDPAIAYGNRGWLQLSQARYAAAIKDFSQALALQPQLPLVYLYRGRAQQQGGNLTAAMADYDHAIAKLPDYPLAYAYRSRGHEAMAEIQQAITDLEQARRLLESRGDPRLLMAITRKLQSLKPRANPRQ
ncbi:MAG: tetratricopeptide repeat protein [Cyanobacteriota bacterium]|nr:tetratricopeptide repeat protein [Cyanobacteriota bacterium]